METRLETDLANLEKDDPIHNDQEYCDAICLLMKTEQGKPLSQQDVNFLNECVNAILSVKQQNTEQAEQAAINGKIDFMNRAPFH